MCLAIPAKLVEINGEKGKVETGGVRREVNLALVEDVNVGDYLIIHAGFALEKLDPREAEMRIKIFEELAAEVIPDA